MIRFRHWIRAALFAVLLAGAAVPPSATAQVRTLKAVGFAGKRYVALADLAAMYGLPLTPQAGKTHLVRGQNVSLLFTENQRKAVINGTAVWLHAPLTAIKGKWYVSDADAQFVIDPLVRPSAYLGGRGTQTVVLDAGHGGKDPGASSKAGLREKDVALDIALRVRAHLLASGLRVAMTRDSDKFLELEDRPALAAKQKGDLFVSIHLNATAGTAVKGIETFATAAENYPATADGDLSKKHAAVPNNKFNHSSTALANQIQKALIGITRAEDRGVKRARFVVIRESAMPAALVECGFLTNAAEAQKLATPAHRETIARGIAQGILNYIALVNRAKKELGAPVVQTPSPLMPDAKPVIPAPAPAPAAPAPTPVVSRSFTQTPVQTPPVAPAPAPAPVPVTPASPAPTIAPAVRPAPVPVAPHPAPVISAPAPAPAAYPPVPIAPPPNNLLNPGLAPHPAN
jgi:N-acetylmuramoyl-L-alanine amidase